MVVFIFVISSLNTFNNKRNSIDFEYELQMAALNKSLNSDVETIFIMSSHEYSFLSSSSVKEIAAFSGEFKDFVPLPVYNALKEKFK